VVIVVALLEARASGTDTIRQAVGETLTSKAAKRGNSAASLSAQHRLPAVRTGHRFIAETNSDIAYRWHGRLGRSGAQAGVLEKGQERTSRACKYIRQP
jgi:hypothetical protein